jgi:hypothetical protein
MILGEPALTTGSAEGQGHLTLDALFRHAAARRPGAIALADGPNREKVTDGPPRRLSFAQADRVISAIAARFRAMGLPTDAVVGIQLPHTVENVLTILGVLRAGLIAAPIPLLWRRADVVAALGRAGAKAFVTCGRANEFDHGQFALRVAAEVFSIRYVCGFGEALPDGTVPFDDLFDVTDPDPVTPLGRAHDAAAHLALITFEIGANGPVPVARRHLEFLAGGLSLLLEGALARDAAILSAIAPATFAGICLTLVPWLLSGGSLVLHHPFDREIFAHQLREECCGTLILPAPIAFGLAKTGLFALEGPTTILASWHAPERLAESADWRERDAVLTDVPIFGEAGLIAARRGSDGRPAPLPCGAVVAPRGSAAGMSVAELMVTDAGTIALRGPIVPRHVFPPGIAESGQPYFAIGRDGTVDTGHPCQADAVSNTVIVTGPPAGIANVGGYRVPLDWLREQITRIDPAATITAMPDPLLGQRLAGTAPDREAMRVALAGLGLNPLVVSTFAGRGDEVKREAVA